MSELRECAVCGRKLCGKSIFINGYYNFKKKKIVGFACHIKCFHKTFIFRIEKNCSNSYCFICGKTSLMKCGEDVITMNISNTTGFPHLRCFKKYWMGKIEMRKND